MPSLESFSVVVDSDDSSPILFSQIIHTSGDRAARINFLISTGPQSGENLLAAWDYLSYKAGEMGAFNILVDIEETSCLFESLRKAGFNVYGWETVWKFPSFLKSPENPNINWVLSTPADEPVLRSLFQSLVPPLVQSAEAYANGSVQRFVYRTENEIVAYVESNKGPDGIYLKPIIHLSVADIQKLLTDLMEKFFNFDQPVYLQVRSYQAWLLNTLEKIGGESSGHFSLLVKHLAILQRNGVVVSQHNRTDNRQTEPTTPMVNNIIELNPHQKQ
ncbi:MAG: hypothetical protein NTZ74_09850 [Chloroflexi bacterium]|nr:hypothetical protein [Chloroflexota bacterium]